MRMSPAPAPQPVAPSREPTLQELRLALQRVQADGSHADYLGDETRGDIISRMIANKETAMGLREPVRHLHRIQPTGEQIAPKPESRTEKVAGVVLGVMIALGGLVLILHKLGALTK